MTVLVSKDGFDHLRLPNGLLEYFQDFVGTNGCQEELFIKSFLWSVYTDIPDDDHRAICEAYLDSFDGMWTNLTEWAEENTKSYMEGSGYEAPSYVMRNVDWNRVVKELESDYAYVELLGTHKVPELCQEKTVTYYLVFRRL